LVAFTQARPIIRCDDFNPGDHRATSGASANMSAATAREIERDRGEIF
jgi:hypothetical protein